MKLDPTDVEAFRPLIAQVVRDTIAAMGAAQPNGRRDLEVFTEDEAAEQLRMKKHQLRDQRLLGKIGFARGPRRGIRYMREHLDRYLAGLPPVENGAEK